MIRFPIVLEDEIDFGDADQIGHLEELGKKFVKESSLNWETILQGRENDFRINGQNTQ